MTDFTDTGKDDALEALLQDAKATINDNPAVAADDVAAPASEPAPPSPENSKTTKKHSSKWYRKRFHIPRPITVMLIVVLALLAAVFVARLGWKLADDVLALTRPDEDVTIEIAKTDDLDVIVSKLHDSNVIDYPWLFKLYCSVTGADESFGEGIYRINKTYDYHAIANNLVSGSSVRQTVRVTVIEGMNCYGIFDLLDENGVCSRQELEEAVEMYDFDYDFLEDAPMSGPGRLEGYLFPDTYEFYYHDDPERVLNKFLKNFNREVDDDVLDMVDESGFSLPEILTIASIIEKESTGVKTEAGDDIDRQNVSSVIHNRLKSDLEPYLKMDSTVNYAMMLQNRDDFDINVDSGYNTYLVKGLPEGPICCPGKDAILAALQPTDAEYLYFATGKDGNNRFFFEAFEFNAFVTSDEYLYN